MRADLSLAVQAKAGAKSMAKSSARYRVPGTVGAGTELNSADGSEIES